MPNSVLWVCLVAVWLFVLVPMVIKGRPQVKKSTDVARATRLLHRGGTRTRSVRRRAAGSHPHDPEWKSQRRTTTRTAGATAVIDEADTERDAADTDLDATDLDVETGEKVTEKATAVSEATDGVEDTATDAADSDAADSDTEVLTGVVEDGADAADSDEDVRVTVTHVEIDVVEVEVDVIGTVSAAGVEELTEYAEYEDDLAEDAEYDDDLDDDEYDEYEDSEYEDSEYAEYDDDVDDADAEYDDDLEDDAEYDDDLEDDAEYVDDLDDEYDEYEDAEPVKPDTKKAEAEAEPAAAKSEKTTRRRSPYSPEAGADRLRYKERQRVSIGLIALVIVAVVAGAVLGTFGWIATGVTVLMLVGYLFYLRRTVKAEQQIRAQRAARARRAARAEAERLARQERVPEFAATPPPPRLRRPGGAVVLEIDDEDPVFDHLPPFQRRRVMREDPDFRQAVAG
ncbi:divisome protein SepX/GlpR [Gordonia sp. NPDC003376]